MPAEPTTDRLARMIDPRPDRAPGPPRLLAMLSGGGRTILNLLDAIEGGALRAQIPLVLASRPCAGAERLRARGLEVETTPEPLSATRLGRILRERDIDWVVLGGYLRLVPIPPGYRGRIVNIHPAPLPEFGGPGMFGRRVHQAVLRAGRERSGCTVHLCDEQYDHGPIVFQRDCPVEPGDTPETLAARVFELEKRAYPEALRRLFEAEHRLDPPPTRERTEPR